MSPEAIAAILVSLSTFIGGVVLAYRGLSGDKFQRKVTESAALLTGYTEMVSNLRKEIDAMRQAHSMEVERVQRTHRVELESMALLHKEERDRWVEERARFEERIDELEGKVTSLLYRAEDSKVRGDDAPA